MWVYGNRRNEALALLAGAVVLLAVTQALEAAGGTAAVWARWVAVGLSVVLGVAAAWLYLTRKG